MPYINCRVMEGVLTDGQKSELAQRITDSFASVVGEATRPLIWVVIDDITSGQLRIGGESVTTESVQQLLGRVPAGV